MGKTSPSLIGHTLVLLSLWINGYGQECNSYDVNIYLSFTCEVYDWTEMRCEFKFYSPWVDSYLFLHTNNTETRLPCEIIPPRFVILPEQCTWKKKDGFKQGSIYDIVAFVVSTSNRNCTAKRGTDFDTRTIVKPARVTHLKPTAKNSTCLEIAWRNTKPEREKRCYIEIKSVRHTFIWEHFTNNASIQMISVCWLYPYTKYRIEVKCEPSQGGIFSDETATEYTMPEDVPSSSPVLYVYNEAPHPDDKDLRRVTVYWKAVPALDQNGRIISYELKVNGTTRNFTDVAINHGLVNLSWNKDYEIKIRAYTKIGASFYSRPLYVKSKISKPDTPAVFYAVGNKESNGTERGESFKVELYWTKPKFGWDLVTNYTLYYCQGWNYNHTCKGNNSGTYGDLDWQHLPPGDTSLTLTLNNTAEEYLFGITADTPTFSSGLLWSSCTYSLNQKPVKAPKNFEFSEVKGDLSLTIQWQGYTCEESGPVLWYILRYCPVEGKTMPPNCTGLIEEKDITANQTSWTLHGLEAERTYAVSLQAFTNGGLGPATPWVYSSAVKIATTLSRGQIAGISIGSLFVLSFAVVGCIVCGRRMHKKIQDDTIIILPPPLPDMLDSCSGGPSNYAVCSFSESTTPRNSEPPNDNTTLSRSDLSRSTKETAQVSPTGYISNTPEVLLNVSREYSVRYIPSHSADQLSTSSGANEFITAAPIVNDSGYFTNDTVYVAGPHVSPTGYISNNPADLLNVSREYSVRYIPNHSVDQVSTSSGANEFITATPTLNDSGYITNDTVSVADPQVSPTGYIPNNPKVLLNVSHGYSPDDPVSNSGLVNSKTEVVASPGYVTNAIPGNAYLPEDPSNTDVPLTSGYLSHSLPLDENSPKSAEPDGQFNLESFKSDEFSRLLVADGLPTNSRHLNGSF